MNFSIFSNDEMLGAIATPIGRVEITATVRIPTSDAQTAKRLIESALRAGSWEFESVHGNFMGLTNLTQLRVITKMYTSLDPFTISRLFKTDIEAAGFPVYMSSVIVLERYKKTTAPVRNTATTPKAGTTTPKSGNNSPGATQTPATSNFVGSFGQGVGMSTPIVLGAAALLLILIIRR